MRMLTPGYDLRITRDSVVAYLPYFGRAYSAPLNLMGGGVQFTSIKFDYKVEERKKGGWNIIIKPNDVDDNQQLNLTVFSNGSASVQVTSNNRQAIQFNIIIKMNSSYFSFRISFISAKSWALPEAILFRIKSCNPI